MQELPKKGEKRRPSKSEETDRVKNGGRELAKENETAERSYYYDDAYGYEDYEPEDDETSEGKD